MTTGERRLNGQVAAVIGAGRGIGRAIAARFAAEGASLVLAARTDTELEAVADACRAAGVRCEVTTADVTKPADLARLFSTVAAFGRLDVLVNAAGILGPVGPLQDTDPALWEQTVRVNLFGTVKACRGALTFMTAQRSGSIINFSGGGASSPMPRFSAYAASKAAVVRFTETLALELSDFGIRVNAIAPGMVDTSIHEGVIAAPGRAGREHLEKVQRLRESGSGGTPPELVAELALFLASAESRGLTGRLISAPHDTWREWDAKRIERIGDSPWYTLRRIDSHTLTHLGEVP